MLRATPLLLVGALLGHACPAMAADAWVGAERANVRLGPGADSPVIGELEQGARVEVEPGEAEPGWTRLVPFGAVRTRLLVTTPPEDGDFLSGPFRYARVRVRSTELREAPDPEAKVIGVRSRGQIVAVHEAASAESEWLETAHREFLLRSAVKFLEPSPFHGVTDPPGRLAFLVRAVRPVSETGESTEPLARGTALEVLAVGKRVLTPSGTVPRSAVRLAWARVRPAEIGPDDRWVHVDTDQQTLTAYEGDRMVFATLVSTGKKEWETPTGVFRVWLKVRHALMHGHRVPYRVEEVPDILYFSHDVALHAAAWHGRFGTPVSHGCVNLSMQDGEWLFRWAPPELPSGWHALNPGAAGLPTLWVVVEESPPDTATWPPSVTRAP